MGRSIVTITFVCLAFLGSYIKILEDQLDELIVETSKKRKQWPKKILVHVIQSMKAEQEMLVSNLRFFRSPLLIVAAVCNLK